MYIVAIYGVLNQIVEYRFIIEKNTRQPICPKIKKSSRIRNTANPHISAVDSSTAAANPLPSFFY